MITLEFKGKGKIKKAFKRIIKSAKRPVYNPAKEYAQEFVDSIKRQIRYQQFLGSIAPLSPVTLRKRKGRKIRSTKIFWATGEFYNKLRVVNAGRNTFIGGALDDDVHEDSGFTMAELSHILLTGGMNAPARDILTPTVTWLLKQQKVRNNYRKHIIGLWKR